MYANPVRCWHLRQVVESGPIPDARREVEPTGGRTVEEQRSLEHARMGCVPGWPDRMHASLRTPT